MKPLAVCTLLALLALPAAGIEPYLVKDVDPVASQAGSEPSHLVNFRGAVLFFADDGVTGRQLWRTDGTAAGTVRLTETGFAQPIQLMVTERLYFFLSAHPLLSVASLWVSDGTAAGTFELTDPDVQVVSLTRAWVASRGVLYFTARDAEHGSELWRSDGTPGGTRLVEDIRPGPEGSEVLELTPYRGRAWFSANDGQHGRALWRSDGTEAGTALAIDTRDSPEHIRVVGNRLTFFALPPGKGRGRQLWAGDGTPRGTHPVTRFSTKAIVALERPVVHANRLWFLVADDRGELMRLWVSDGTGRGTRQVLTFPAHVTTYGLDGEQGLPGLFVFRAYDEHGVELWSTDGTAAGSRLLADVCPGPCSSLPFPVKAFAGRLYFTAEDSFGRSLWSTDGTPEGTRQVSSISLENPYGFFAVGGHLLFVGRDLVEGWEIWRTNGPEGPTFQVTDFEPPFLWEQEDFSAAVLDGQLLFNADDGVHGFELWRTDGTLAGTSMIEDINQVDTGGSFPTALRPLGDEVVFSVRKVDGAELWRSDGTAEGTVRFRTFGLEDLDGASPAGAFAEAGGLLFYFGYEIGDRYTPWRTDGTAEGTFQLTEAGVPGCCSRQEMEALGNRVFFDLKSEQHGLEPWVSDGTQAGTRLLKDVMPGPADSLPLYFTAFEGNLYFAAAAPGLGRELWRSDGTAEGTVPLDLMPGDAGSNPLFLTVHLGRLWFFAEDERGIALWSSDGTLAGTRLEVDVLPGGSLAPLFLVSLGDRLILSTHGQGLWVSDGTAEGTRKLAVQEVDAFNRPDTWIVFQNRLYFVATDGTLWVTAGTQTGTGQLRDHEGHEIFSPGRFAVLGDRLVFTAPDLFGNLVLWESDGTPDGTFQVVPRVEIGSPVELVRAGNLVFFPSYDPATGWELWAARP